MELPGGGRPDTKTQVTCEYVFDKGTCVPIRVHTVVVSCQHSEKVTLEALRKDIMDKVVYTTIPKKYLDADTKFHINSFANFVIGGPMGDAGLTGRKDYCGHIRRWRFLWLGLPEVFFY